MPVQGTHYNNMMNSNFVSSAASSTGSSKTTNQTSQSIKPDSAAPVGVTIKGAKGKLFQCTGFGDCRMVFTRSEHLARHARKHTGEKPFKCVVEGCNRMFSRFDNMVQHTQTHTKGPRRESSAGIASKIALESRRKSEANLLASGRASKGSRAKRASISSASGSEAPRGRKSCIQSVPMIYGDGRTDRQGSLDRDSSRSSSTRAPPSPISSSNSPTRHHSPSRASHRARRGSLDSGAVPPSSASGSGSGTMSWYASMLHQQPSTSLHRYDPVDRLSHNYGNPTLPPPVPQRYSQQHVRYPQDPFHDYPMRRFSLDSSMLEAQQYRRPRHPLSPERSEDDDSDEYNRLHDHQGRHGGMVDSIDNVTLPPLRSPSLAPAYPTRLPSIAQAYSGPVPAYYGARRSSLTPSLGGDDYEHGVPRTRRLSLADLDAPITETKKVVHSTSTSTSTSTSISTSISTTDFGAQQPPVATAATSAAPYEGVEVSEDEIQALEAFGELWSQGREMEVEPSETSLQSRQIPPHQTQAQQQSTTQYHQNQQLPMSLKATSCDRLTTMIKAEPMAPAPGIDHGRRAPRMYGAEQETVPTAGMDLD